MAKGIKDYFKNDKDFANEHKNFCENFLKDLQKEGYSATYGQAQKIVNMAFKYLYCCDGVDRSKFKDCHMALDSFTLNWYIREVCEEGTSNVGKWSKIDDIAYKNIQTDIRNHLKGKIVIEEEFIIWPDEILIAATKEFNDTFKKIKDSNYPGYNKRLTDTINNIKENLYNNL